MAPSDCSSGSLKMIRAPKCRAIRLRASLTLPGITRATGTPRAAPTQAYAIPVFPLVESRSVRPRRVGSASWMMAKAGRSFTLPPGLNHSSLAWISTPGGSSERRRTRGVSPTGRPGRAPPRGTTPRGPCPGRTRPAAGAGRSAPAAPGSASAGDRRYDGQPVAFLQLRSKPLRVADVLVVAEEVHVTAESALV